MSDYLGRFHVVLHDFNELLPPFADVKKELDKLQYIFMTLGLYGLLQEYAATCEEIFRSPINLTMTFTSFFCS